MPTRKFVQSFVLLTMMPSAILWLHAQSSQNVPGIALDQLEMHNVKAEAANYSGKPAVRVDALPDAANGASYAIWTGCGRNRRRNMNRTWTWSRGYGPSTGS